MIWFNLAQTVGCNQTIINSDNDLVITTIKKAGGLLVLQQPASMTVITCQPTFPM